MKNVGRSRAILIEYLGECKTEFENNLGFNLGPRDNRLMKNRGSKISYRFETLNPKYFTVSGLEANSYLK
jgi:hypothetical protein